MPAATLKVIKASAGSGKTYSLIKEYLLLALLKNKADGYQHILAITFTNAATAEMKERFINALQKFATPESYNDPMATAIRSELAISHEELMDRCKSMFTHVLHNYDLLSISTIDSFTQRLIRTFARDLKLNYDFTIETDLEKFIDQVVDRCLNDLIGDEELRKYLIQFANESLDDEKNWNPKEQLKAFTNYLFNEDSIEAFNQQPDLNLSDYTDLRNRLKNRLSEFEQTIAQYAKSAIDLLQQHQLTTKDFMHSGNGYINRLFAIAENNIIDPPANRFSQMLEEPNWWKKSEKNPHTIRAISEIQEELRGFMLQIYNMINGKTWEEYQLTKLVHQSIYRLGLFNKLQKIAQELKAENNSLTFSDFHQLIGEIVRESDAPFIYERIGIRYHHILIDEFQDTSALQWNNAIPLIINSLSEGNTALLVGDAKQSIYRWRGGKASQFINLPKLDESATTQYPVDILKPYYKPQTLNSNFRSARSIVAFNNSLYTSLCENIPSLQSIYKDAEQIHVKKHIGYIKVQEIQEDKQTEHDQSRMAQFILEAIAKSIEAGYAPSEITILTRKNNETQQIAHLLSKNHYSTQSKESFLLEHSPSVRAIIGFIGANYSSQSKSYSISAVEALAEIDPRISVMHFAEHFILTQKSFDSTSIWTYLSQFYDFKNFKEAHSVLEKLYILISTFKLDQDVYLEFLIESFRQKCVEGNLSLTDLINYWQEQKHKIYITTSTNRNAIQLMTVHKSKGLQFPVVIYPCYKPSNNQKEIWVSVDPSQFGISKALVRPKKDTPLKEVMEEEVAAMVDDVNVCYVATTRAEDRLYMAIEKKGNSTDLNDHLLSVIKKKFEENQKNPTTWIFGHAEEKNPKIYPESRIVEIAQISLKHITSKKIRSNTQQSEDILFGAFIHQCLANLHHYNDIERAVSACFKPNIHSQEWRTKAIRHLLHVFTNTTIRQWFDEDARTKTEMELLSDDGKTLIPDRVVFYEDRLEVIDFKTGQKRPEHKEQVSLYATTLKKMYTIPVYTYLVYTEFAEVVQI